MTYTFEPPFISLALHQRKGAFGGYLVSFAHFVGKRIPQRAILYTRVSNQERTRSIIAAVGQLPRTAIVVVGLNPPSIRTQLDSRRNNLKQYVYLI